MYNLVVVQIFIKKLPVKLHELKIPPPPEGQGGRADCRAPPLQKTDYQHFNPFNSLLEVILARSNLDLGMNLRIQKKIFWDFGYPKWILVRT